MLFGETELSSVAENQYRHCIYVLPEGQTRHLELNDMCIEALDFWASPHIKARYPIKWRDGMANKMRFMNSLTPEIAPV